MNDTANLEMQLDAGGEVRLGRREAHEVLQKLRARGARTEAADRLESRLTEEDEVVLAHGEAQQLLEELKASGRRWISGTDARRPEPPKAEEPEPELEPEPRGWRFWRSR